MNILAIIAIAALVAIDHFTKYLAVVHLKPVGTLPILDNVFSLTYVENSGAAFGLFQGFRWIFIVITMLILIFMLAYYLRTPKTTPYIYIRICIILIAAGASGNFIDRITKGYVVDFLHATFIDFPVFNFADCLVSVGALSLILLLFFVIKD